MQSVLCANSNIYSFLLDIQVHLLNTIYFIFWLPYYPLFSSFLSLNLSMCILGLLESRSISWAILCIQWNGFTVYNIFSWSYNFQTFHLFRGYISGYKVHIFKFILATSLNFNQPLLLRRLLNFILYWWVLRNNFLF